MPDRRLPRLLLGIFLFAMSAFVFAAPFQLQSSTVDGGGGHSQGTRFALEGTTGQPDAGRPSGQRFSLDGGFWQKPSAARADTIFNNGFED